MAGKSQSKVKGLHKWHNRGCPNKGTSRPTACNCPWIGKYKSIYKSLGAWSGQDIDPRTKSHAVAVLNRLKAAVDNGTYDPDGEQLSLGSAQRVIDFVEEWKTHYARERGLSSNSLDSMLGLLTKAFGRRTMEQMAGASVRIERWLNSIEKERGWTSDNTWNRYYELFNSLFNRAMKWERLTTNPMVLIDKRVGSKKKFETRIEEDVEDRLIAACDQLNRPQHQPHSIRLTWEKVREIRRRVERGERQKEVAEEFGISTGLCSQIVKGHAGYLLHSGNPYMLWSRIAVESELCRTTTRPAPVRWTRRQHGADSRSPRQDPPDTWPRSQLTRCRSHWRPSPTSGGGRSLAPNAALSSLRRVEAGILAVTVTTPGSSERHARRLTAAQIPEDFGESRERANHYMLGSPE